MGAIGGGGARTIQSAGEASKIDADRRKEEKANAEAAKIDTVETKTVPPKEGEVQPQSEDDGGNDGEEETVEEKLEEDPVKMPVHH